MTDSATQREIRDLVTGWVSGIASGSLGQVLAHHAEDIVMFDVPPPERGVRGLESYAATWPGFFEWMASGAVFELDELDIVAGDDVAFAMALLRCGNPEDLESSPGKRLRLTLGLVKRSGMWVVQHEHHSFTYVPDPFGGEHAVSDIHTHWFADTSAKDLDGIMRHVAEDVVSYEHETPLEYVGADQVREVCRAGLEQTPGAVTWTVPELTVIARDDLAVALGAQPHDR